MINQSHKYTRESILYHVTTFYFLDYLANEYLNFAWTKIEEDTQADCAINLVRLIQITLCTTSSNYRNIQVVKTDYWLVCLCENRRYLCSRQNEIKLSNVIGTMIKQVLKNEVYNVQILWCDYSQKSQNYRDIKAFINHTRKCTNMNVD